MKFVPILSCVILVLCGCGAGAEEAPEAGGKVEARIATVGLDPLSGSPVVVLQELGTGRLLPIWVGLAEARAIAIGLEGIELPRPMTHDLLRSVLETSDLSVEGVLVEKLEGATYFGKIFGHRKLPDGTLGDAFEIDSRPSDAMALALRLGVPISVSEALLVEIPEFEFTPGGDADRLRALGLLLERPPADAPDALPGGSPGLIVRSLLPGAPEGIEVGDIVLKASGKPLTSTADLVDVLRGTPEKPEISLMIERGGKTLEIRIPRTPRTSPPAQDTLQV